MPPETMTRSFTGTVLNALPEVSVTLVGGKGRFVACRSMSVVCAKMRARITEVEP